MVIKKGPKPIVGLNDKDEKKDKKSSNIKLENFKIFEITKKE